MKKIYIALLITILSKMVFANTRYLYIDNNLKTYSIEVSAIIVNKNNNPDGDEWVNSSGTYTPGKLLPIVVNGPFSTKGVVASVNPYYKDFDYNSTSNIGIAIIDPTNNNVISRCYPNVYFDSLGTKLAIVTQNQDDIIYCDNADFYVQDDRRGLNSGYLFVHQRY